MGGRTQIITDDEHIEIYNAVALAKRWWQRRWTFFYADTPDYKADNILERRGVNVKYGSEFRNDDEKYIIVTCKILPDEIDDFLEAMHTLQNLMIIAGYTDYEDFCRKMSDMLEG